FHASRVHYSNRVTRKTEARMPPSSRYRVLMLLENNPYPQDPRVSREVRALVDAGYQVAIIAPGDPDQARHELLDGVRVYRFPAPPPAPGLLGYLWEYGYSMVVMFLLSLVALWRDGFDVVHAHNPPDTLVFIGAFYKLLGKRFVYDHHDLAPELYYARFGGTGNRWVHKTLVWLETLSCRLADHVITTNQSHKALEMARSGIPGDNITIVRNGPDPSRLCPVAPDPALLAKGKTIIAYSGMMGVQDGIDYLLRALRHLAYDLERRDFFCILLGGRGEAVASLQALSRELGLDEYVWFAGWISDRDEYARYLSSADICVDPDPSNPYNDRSTMIKMMEYMAMAKPIVAFDLPEHRFSAQAAALYVRPNDELEFARAIAQLMDDPAHRQTMGALGRRRVETELAWHHSAPNLLAAYQALQAGRLGERLPSL
ncbi:MAG TPA: glycosyltransferase family 4 protein, partial [Ardenticatenaceae bacterium]|nr:glycosyltransferase family 4 protein [Ardenticatenaceae bacterium]